MKVLQKKIFNGGREGRRREEGKEEGGREGRGRKEKGGR